MFIPTYLYIKQHKVTGLKYFGKTISDPLNYKGSGTYWRRHIKVHDNNVNTIWFKLFDNREELVEFATKFSIDNNIVESKEWANLILENGLNGGSIKGNKRSIESKLAMSKSRKGKQISKDHKNAISIGKTGILRTSDHITNNSIANMKICIINGVEYVSNKEAAKLLNISKTTISRRCKDNRFPMYYYQIDKLIENGIIELKNE